MTTGDERPHKKLEVWREAMALDVRIYKSTKEFPESEAYDLSSQMRGSAIYWAASFIIASPDESAEVISRRGKGIATHLSGARNDKKHCP